MEKMAIKVERETFEMDGKTYFGYFIKGNIRGRDVKIGIKPPDNGGYTVLDIVFDGAMAADLEVTPFEMKTEDGKVIAGNTYAVTSRNTPSRNSPLCRLSEQHLQDKRSDKVKWVVSFLLIFVLLAGLIGAWALLLKPEESAPEQNEGGAIITEGEGNGIKLMSAKIAPEDYAANGISAMAETAYQLTATVTPENATNKAVDWAVSFVNPSGEWATGKTVTDYVTVTPTADGALTANVECVKDFGEQVRVTVTSRDNTSVKANATVDYTQKLKGVNATFGSTRLWNGMKKSFDLDASGQPAEVWKFDYTTSAHTIEDEYTTTVKISFSSRVSLVEDAVGVKFTWAGETITSGMPSFDKTFFDKVFVTADGAVSANAEQYNKLVNALAKGIGLFDVEVSVTGTYSSKINIISITVTSDGMNICVEGIELGDTSIIF